MTDIKTDYARRFGGVLRLYGAAAFARFEQAHVAVLGVGGVGSWVVEALARSAVGTLTLVDLDNVAESNVNRQLQALTGAIGKVKTTALRERVLAINPRAVVQEIEDFVTPENVSGLITPQFDWVVDCIDNYRVKGALIDHCKRNKLRLLTVGGAGGLTDPTRIRQTDLTKSFNDPLLQKTRRLLREHYGFTQNPKRRFDVPCVFSEEPIVYATEDGTQRFRRRAQAGLKSATEDSEHPLAGGADGLSGVAGRLTCAGGLGSVVTVTAAFGFTAAAFVLNKIAHS